MNAQLNQPYTEADITEALSQMHPTKAPGPDGLPAAFFQKHWKSVVSRHAKYLGLPSMVGRNKTSFFKDIKLRVLGKISSWQANLFSCGEKEVLINDVAQVVPAYAMSVFKLPLGLCDDMQKAIASFCLMQAQLGSYPSFIWRSILWGRNVLEKGLRWRIGNGEQLLVYQSQWIPRSITFQPISPPSLSPDTIVAKLISEEQSRKEAVIRQHFLKEDADQILKIPLPRQPKPDQVLWHYDKKGNYSVKSGYQVAMKMNFPEKPSCSSENDKYWHAIWKSLEEDSGAIPLVPEMRKSEMELIVAVCWSIWHSRKLFLFKNKKEDPQLSVAAAEAMVQSYSRIQMPQMQSNSQLSTANQKQWKHPPEGWFKVNVDAAVGVEQQRAGLGIVIRNSGGKFIAAAMKPSKFIGKIDFAEAEAIRLGLEIAENVGCFPLIVESDAQEVVDLVNFKKSSRAEIFWVASEMQDQVKRLNQGTMNYADLNRRITVKLRAGNHYDSITRSSNHLDNKTSPSRQLFRNNVLTYAAEIKE
ncbi:putative reverse transcriptase/RNA-dependent DNA polymerase [Citrus sinensis]|nr:putative reverse transcriptase/RNA-dependent DNA polymerase [Citrus sinensis]